MIESSQHVRHGDQVQPCLIRSHPGPACLQKPESASIECAPAWRRVSCRVTFRQDKPPHFLPLCMLRCAGVMQDKGIPNSVERICTTLLTPAATVWHDMYSIYIFLWQYIAYMHMHLLY